MALPELPEITRPVNLADLPEPPPDVTEVVKALRELRGKHAELQKAFLRAQVLKQQEPLLGPAGAQQGVGPGGWAITAADAFNRALERRRQDQQLAQQEAALGAQAPALTDYQAALLRGQPMKYTLHDWSGLAGPFSLTGQ